MGKKDTVIISREKNSAGPTSREATAIVVQRSLSLSLAPFSFVACARCLCAFSTITMAPSTIVPMVMAIPPKDIILAFKPCHFITINAIRIPIGRVIIATKAERTCSKNKITTKLTTANSCNRASLRLATLTPSMVDNAFSP